MALISLRNIRRTLGDRTILDGVGLQLEPGERVGLVGSNGCGKSTLLAIAAGVAQPDTGERSLRRGLRLGYLEQEPRLEPGTRVRDAVREGLVGRQTVLDRLERVHAELESGCHAPRQLKALLAEAAQLDDRLGALGGYDVEHKVEQLAASLGLDDPDRPCDTLSGGERRRVALARLLLGEPDLLLLDEPTNHLDAGSVAWLEQYLAGLRAALLLVTHDRYLLERVCQRMLELDRGRLLACEGGYLAYVEARAARLAVERRDESARLNLLRREAAWMARSPAARSTKARAREQRYAQLLESAPGAQADELVFRIPPGPRLGTRVVALHGVSKAYGGRTVLDRVELELGQGDRLGVVGPNGAGKSTLLGLCCGTLAPDAGSVAVGETVRFSVIDQQRRDLDPGNTVLAEVAGEGGGVRLGERLLRAESFLDSFLFPGQQKHTLVGRLSGGERNRVQLAKLLLQGGNVLLLDEPTNDLDLSSLAALEQALLAFAGSMLVVSHDRAFLDRVATHVAWLDGQGGVRVDAGGVSAVLERVERERVEQEQAERGRGEAAGRRRPKRGAAAATMRPPAASTGSAARLSNWELNELRELPGQLEQAEAQLADLDRRLADPALYASSAEQRQLVTTEHETLRARVAALYARWEELEARASGEVC